MRANRLVRVLVRNDGKLDCSLHRQNRHPHAKRREHRCWICRCPREICSTNDERSPVERGDKEGDAGDKKFRDDFAFDMKELNSVLSNAPQELFNAAIAISSTAFEDREQDRDRSAAICQGAYLGGSSPNT